MLTPPDVAALSPAWSPDGQRIAYVTAPDAGNTKDNKAAAAQRRIWIMNRDGSGQQSLTNDAAYRDERPRWTGDGRLLFVRLDQNDRIGVWLMGADGSTLTQVADNLGPLDTQAALNTPIWFGYYGHVEREQVFDLAPGAVLQQPAAAAMALQAQPTPLAPATQQPSTAVNAQRLYIVSAIPGPNNTNPGASKGRVTALPNHRRLRQKSPLPPPIPSLRQMDDGFTL